MAGMRFEEINPPKKEECSLPAKKTSKKEKATKVEESTNS